MSKRVWATSEDGSIEYVSITKDLLQESIEAMQKSFYIHENICVAFGVHEQPESFPEMDILLLRAAQDGVSIAAVEKATGKVAGAAFNKLEVREQADFYPEFAKSCKYSGSRGVTKWMCDMEHMFDVYEHCNTDNLFEIMFLGIVPDFRKRGIAKKLFEVSIDVGKKLKQGHNIKVPIDDTPLELGNPPDFVTGIFTSFVTQKIAADLGFSVGARIGFDKLIYDGKPLSAVVEKSTPDITYEYLKL